MAAARTSVKAVEGDRREERKSARDADRQQQRTLQLTSARQQGPVQVSDDVFANIHVPVSVAAAAPFRPVYPSVKGLRNVQPGESWADVAGSTELPELPPRPQPAVPQRPVAVPSAAIPVNDLFTLDDLLRSSKEDLMAFDAPEIDVVLRPVGPLGGAPPLAPGPPMVPPRLVVPPAAPAAAMPPPPAAAAAAAVAQPAQLLIPVTLPVPAAPAIPGLAAPATEPPAAASRTESDRSKLFVALQNREVQPSSESHQLLPKEGRRVLDTRAYCLPPKALQVLYARNPFGFDLAADDFNSVFNGRGAYRHDLIYSPDFRVGDTCHFTLADDTYGNMQDILRKCTGRTFYLNPPFYND